MSLPKLFNRIIFHNNTTPALNETNLNLMSKAVDDIDDRVVEIAGDILVVIPQIQQYLSEADDIVERLEELTENPPYIGQNGNWYVWDTNTGAYVDSGVDASITVSIADITMIGVNENPRVTNTGTNTDPVFHLFIPAANGIANIAKTATSGLTDTYTVTFDNGNTKTFTVVNGRGITKIEKTGTEDLVDTYTITYSDGYTTTFNVTNGKSAYQSAVEGGYDRTEAEFNQELADFKNYADGAAQSAEDSEAWATGMRDGSAVPSTDPTYHNNSKYYSEEADGSAEDAEAWAVGERGGVPVPSTDPTYHNNSKYWSGRSAGQTLGGLQDVNINNPEEGQGLIYDETAEKWVNGKVSNSLEELEDTLITNPQDGESLVYDETEEKWVNRMATTHFITKPTVSGNSFTYNGTAQGPTITGLDADWEDYLTITHRTEINAGTYTLTISIKNTQVNCWNDLTTQDITYEYTIAKAAGDVTLSKNKVELDADHLTGTVDISDATGNVAITSSDTDIATVSPAVLTQDGTVTVSSVNDKSGTATVTVSVAASDNYLATSKTIEVKASFVAIYGAEWDGTSTTAWSRTDDSALFTDPVPQHADGNGGWTQGSSPFDTLQPWAGMTKITHASAGVVVKIPKFWYKITQNGAGLKIQIADGEVDGFSVSPAHMDRGDGDGERDEILVGRYHCCNTDYKSATGDTPKVKVTRSAARSGIHNLGNDIWQMDFATWFSLRLLYIVEFADWNSQAKIGGGCAPAGSTSAVRNMGYTDGMTYHTGTDQTTIGAEVYGGTQYRNIEGLWDNCYDWLDGCYNNANGLNIILDPSSFSDDTGGTAVGIPSNGWPAAFTKKEVSGTFPMFIASATGGSSTTYSCDYWDFGASGPCVCAGGSYSQSQYRGLFYLGYGGVSSSAAGRGCRLLILP